MKKIELMCVAPRTLPARHGHAEVVMAEAVITIIEVIAVMDWHWAENIRRAATVSAITAAGGRTSCATSARR